MMKASFITGIRSVEARDIKDAHPQQSDEALIRVAYAGICETDLELYDGTSNYLRRGLTEYPHHYGDPAADCPRHSAETRRGGHWKYHDSLPDLRFLPAWAA